MVKIEEIREMFFSQIEEFALNEGYKEYKASKVGGIIRISKKITEKVSWAILDYGETKQFLGFGAYNSHTEVREVTLPVLVKHGMIGASAKIKNWSPLFRPKNGFPGIDTNRLEFRTLEEISFLKEAYVDFFINEAIPYFKKWDSVLKIYDYIKDIEDDQETGLGQFPVYEKAVIMRLCNDNSYKEYFLNYYKKKEAILLEDPNDEDRIMYYNAAKEMLDILDNIQPRYNL